MSESGPNKYVTEADERVMVDLGDYRNLHRRVEALEDELKRLVCLVSGIPPELLAPSVISASLEDAKRLEAEWGRKCGLTGTGYATGGNSCVTRADADPCTDHGVPRSEPPAEGAGAEPVPPLRRSPDAKLPDGSLLVSDRNLISETDADTGERRPVSVLRPHHLDCVHCHARPLAGYMSLSGYRFICGSCYLAGKR